MTSKIKHLETGQIFLKNEWSNNKFVKDIFVVDSSETCQSKFKDAETLFSYNWPGLRPLYNAGDEGEPHYTVEESSFRKVGKT